MYATDRQIDVRQIDATQKHRLVPPPIRGGGIIKSTEKNMNKNKIKMMMMMKCCNIKSNYSNAIRLFACLIRLCNFAARKRGLCCRPVSVRPPVCHVGAFYPHG